MNTYSDKTLENKSQSVENRSSKSQSIKSDTLQFVDNRPEATQMRKLQAMADKHSTEQQHPIQKKENKTGLPDNLKSGIENISGYSMDDVKVHFNSDKPAQLQAHAYAQGSNIHIASGQEKHLPHEAWHVVQQKQGRVKPTMQMKGKVNINDDAGLEKEADVMGSKAVTQRQPINKPQKINKANTNYIKGHTIQRVILNNKKRVSSSALYAAIRGEETSRRRNPYNINYVPTLASYMFQYYNLVYDGNINLSDVVRIYWRTLTATMDARNVKATALDSLKHTLRSEQNQASASSLTSMTHGTNPLVIYRGTSPVQATQILINRTLGGATSAGKNRPSPGEKAASEQTGVNIKDTAGGRIEEWSWKKGGLSGFSTGGVMLIGLVNKASVATTSVSYGEMGATGYVNQPLIDVAVLYIGKNPVTPDLILFAQEARKIFDRSVGALDKTQVKTTSTSSSTPHSSSTGAKAFPPGFDKYID